MTIGVPEPIQPSNQDLKTREMKDGKDESTTGLFPKSIEYFVMVEKDGGVFGEIFDSIKKGWEFLAPEEKTSIERYARELLEAV